jgi:hypothetical protein
MRSSLALPLALALGSAALVAGCTVKSTDTNNPVGSGGGSTTTTTTTTTTTGTGGAGGATGTGGQGGTGVGGAGGTPTTGTGGAGGQPECLGQNGTGMTEAVCDDSGKTPIAAAAHTCDDQGGTSGSNPPPGLGACHGGFQLYTAGAAEAFWYCLSQITVEPVHACAITPVQDCVTKISNESCTDASTSVCGQLKGYCAANDGSFDEAACVIDIAPFSDQAMSDLGTCMDNELKASPAPTCKDAYQKCFDQATGNL